MGDDDNKKSFWTSLPGVLTGIAAVIGAITGIVVAINANHVTTPSPSPTTPLPSPPSSSPSSSPTQQFACGTQLPGVALFGFWNWFGVEPEGRDSGVITFNSDCTYKNLYTDKTTNEGRFNVSGSSPASITLTKNISKEKNTYLITDISEKSFHAHSPDLTVNLVFNRA
jgi:hypothetical protein